jgi:formate-dependent phosphoribosylglycinamide formyltransferase (GAR transformylase)
VIHTPEQAITDTYRSVCSGDRSGGNVIAEHHHVQFDYPATMLAVRNIHLYFDLRTNESARRQRF